MKLNWFFLVFFLMGHGLFAQTGLAPLLDSLAVTKSPIEKVHLSQKIALQLKDKDWDRAAHYTHVALDLAKKFGTEEELAEAYVKAAKLYYTKDALDVALNYYLKAYSFYKTKPPSLTHLGVENSLAVIFARLKDKKRSLKYFKKSYRAAQVLNDSMSMVKALNNLGTAYLNIDLDSSYYFYKRGLKIVNQLKAVDFKAFIYTNIGRNYVLKNKIDSAQIYFDKGKYLVQTASLKPMTKAWVFTATAHFYNHRQNIDSTIYFARKAFETYADTFSFNSQEVVGLLYHSFLKQKNYKQAAHYFSIYDEVRDSLDITQKLANVERLKLEQKFKARQKTKALKESRRQFKYYVIGLSLVILLLVLGVIIIRYHGKLTKTRLKNKVMVAEEKEMKATIELKNRELTGKAMMEIQRQNIIDEILVKLKEVKIKAVKLETRKALNEVAKKLDNSDKLKIWREFILSFEKVYTSFFNNLHQKHPDLTLREKRLCALLKLNLTTKEIAQLSGQSYKSIENARTRLRKKLNLTNKNIKIATYLAEF